MLYMVALPIMDYTVVLFMLVWLVLLVLDGIGGPVYHLNLYNIFYCDYSYQSNSTSYTFHGGASDLGNQNGGLSIALNYVFSIVRLWACACLSFKLIEYFLL